MSKRYIGNRNVYKGLNEKIIDSLNMNQREIIKWAGLDINRTTLSNYIKGISSPPIDIVVRLALLCKVSVNDLIVLEDEFNDEAKVIVEDREITVLHKEGKYNKLMKKVKSWNGAETELPVKIKLNSYISRKPYCYSSLKVFQLGYDEPLIKAQRGTLLIIELDPSLIENKGTNEHYVILQKLSSVFVSIIRKVKDEDGISNIKADIYSYIDYDGNIKLATVNQISSMYRGTIIRLVRNL